LQAIRINQFSEKYFTLQGASCFPVGGEFDPKKNIKSPPFYPLHPQGGEVGDDIDRYITSDRSAKNNKGVTIQWTELIHVI